MATTDFVVKNGLVVNEDALIKDTTDSSSKDTGALIVEGGVGIEKKLYVGTDLSVGGAQTLTGDLAVNGGDLTTTAGTFNLINSSATTVNFAGAATSLEIGAATGTTNINNNLDVDGDVNIDGGDLTVSTTTFNLANTTATTVNFAGAGTAVNIGAATGTTNIKNALDVDGNATVNGSLTVDTNATVTGDLAVNGGDLTTSSATFNLVNATATTVNFAGAATDVQIGAATGTTNINNNLDVDGDVNIDGGDLTVSTATFNLANANAATVNAFGAGTSVNIGAVSGTTTVKNNLTVDLDLQVKGGDITTNQTTFNLVNATATTVNFAGAATDVQIGAATGTTNINNNLDVDGDVNIDGGDLTVSTSTFNLANSTATTVNAFGAATALNLGAATGTTNIKNALDVDGNATVNGSLTVDTNATVTGDLAVNGGDLTTTSATFNLANATATTVNFAGAATDVQIGAATGTTNINNNLDVDGDINIDGGDLTVSTTTFNLANTTATTVNFAGAATALNLGAATGTTNIKNALDVDGDVNIDGGDLTVSTATFNLANSTATTVNAFGAATALNLGAATGTTTINNNTVITGNLTVNGTTTTVNSTTVTYDDPILTLGGDTAQVETSKDRGIEFHYAGATLTITNYIGNGTNVVTATVPNSAGYSAGDIITISGATGTEQSKLNGTWTLNGVPTGTTFTFITSSIVTAGTYNTTIGTAIKAKTGFFGYDQANNQFKFLTGAYNQAEVFSGTAGNLAFNDLTLSGDLAVNGGDITTTATTFNLINATATTVNIAGAATTLSLGNTATGAQTVNLGTASTGASTYNLGTGATANATTKTINLGTGGVSGSTTNINIGSTAGGGTITLSEDTTTANKITSTRTWDAANAAGSIYLNGTTGNRIDWNSNGVAAPALTTRSAGTKLVLYPELSATSVDYAIGIESSTMWFSVPLNGDQRNFKWYGGTTNIATLSSGGSLTLEGDLAVKGGNITTTAATFTIGNTATTAQTLNLGTAATAASTTKTINLGTGAAASSTTNVNIGSSAGGTTTINSGTLVGALATQNLYNTTATTINFGGAATDIQIGAATGTTNINNNLDVDGDVNIDGGDLTVSTATFNLANATATTVNAFGAATALNLGAATGTTNIKNSLDVDGDINIDGGDLTVSTATFNLANSTATTVNAFGAATALNLGAATGTTNIKNSLDVDGDVNIDGGDLTVSTATFNLADANATTVNFARAATALTVGATSGTLTLRNPTVVGTQTSVDLWNTTSTTVNFAGAATVLNMGAATIANIATISRNANVATITTSAAHGLAVGQRVSVVCNTDSTFNAAFVTLITGTTGSTIVYNNTGNNLASTAATGTVTYGITTIKNNVDIDGDLNIDAGDIVTTATTFNLLNNTASTINFGGAGTAINIGAGTGTVTIANPTLTMSGGTAFNMNGSNPAIASTNTGTASIFNANIATINLGQAADISMGGTNKTVTVRNALTVNGNTTLGDASTDTVTVNGNTAIVPNTLTFTVDDATNANVSYPVKVQHTTTGTPANGIGSGIQFIAETTANNNEIGASIETVTTDVTAGTEDFDLVIRLMANGAVAAEKFRITSVGDVTIAGDLAVNGGDITTTATTASVFNTTATTVSAFGAATTFSMGGNSGTLTLGNPTIVGTQATQNLWNTTATTVNAFGAATAITLGATTGTTTIRNTVVANNSTLALSVKSNMDFISPDGTKTINARMLDSDVLTFSGGTGQLFSIADSMTGTIFAVNDISGVPSIEVFDSGKIQLAELVGNVLIGTSTDNGARLQVNGNTWIGQDLIVAGSSIDTASSAFNLLNATPTTVNIAGAATALTVGGVTGTMTLRNPTILGVSSTQDLFNTVATTVNFAGVATALTVGATSGTLTLRNPTIVGSQATQALFNTVATTLNIGGAATALNLGATTGTATINNPTVVGSQATQNLYNTVATTLNIGGAATALNLGASSGTTTINNNLVTTGDAEIRGGDLTTNQATFNLVNTTATTVNFAGSALNLAIGNTATGAQSVNMFTASTGASTYNFATGATAASTTKTLNIGTGGAASSTTNINIGSSAGGTITLYEDTTTANKITSTRNWSATTNDGSIYLNGTTGNRIDWNQNGVAAPSFTTRSAGTKLVLYPNVSASAVDFALGIESSTMWFSTYDNSGGQFKWYHGTTNTMTLGAGGALTVGGDVAVNGGDLTTNQTTFNLITSTATTLNIGSAATTITEGYTGTAASTHNIATGAVAALTIKTVNIGTGGAASSTTNINLGSTSGGTITTNAVIKSGLASGSTVLDFASTDGYASMRVIRNNTSVGGNADGMYIGYGNSSSGVTRLYGGGSTTVSATINAGTTSSTSTTTGAVVINGGTGISENLYVGGLARITNTTASTSTSTGALVVSGGVGIQGALNATTKSFDIDHPTKPGQRLRHGSLEGPEFGVYVRGRLRGTNVIELPEYWTALVDRESITVQLTPIGKHQNLFVDEIVDNTVVVGNSNVFGKEINCFYVVYGERIDIDKLEVEID